MTEGSTIPETLDELALVTCRQHFAAIMRHSEAARRGDDPEGLHDMRVALRRLIATIRLFEDHLPTWAISSRRALRPLLRTLGEARDLDVQLKSLSPERASEREPILRRDRSKAQKALVAALDSAATRKAFQAWSAERRATRGATPTGAIHSFAADAIRKRHKRLRKAIRSLSDDSRPEEYHAVRSRVKRLRYSLEVFTPLYGRRAEKYVRTLARLQDTLGEYHDTEVSRWRDEDLARRKRAEADAALPRVSSKRWKKLRARLSHPTKKRAGTSWPSLQASS